MKNCNQHFPYVIKNVSTEDYLVMKAEEPNIVKEVEKRLYNVGVVPSKIPSFAYNPYRQAVAMYFKDGRNVKSNRRFVVSEMDVDLMSDIEKKAFCVMRHLLEEGLQGRLEKEVWE